MLHFLYIAGPLAGIIQYFFHHLLRESFKIFWAFIRLEIGYLGFSLRFLIQPCPALSNVALKPVFSTFLLTPVLRLFTVQGTYTDAPFGEQTII